jgi:hypothetical protein
MGEFTPTAARRQFRPIAQSIARIRTSTTVFNALEAVNGTVRKTPAERGVERCAGRIEALEDGRATLVVMQVATIVMGWNCINRNDPMTRIGPLEPGRWVAWEDEGVPHWHMQLYNNE